MIYRLYSLLQTLPSHPSTSTVIIVTVHAPLYIRQNIYARRNIARGKLYLRGLNYGCVREVSVRNEQLDKRCAKRKSRRYLTRIQRACCQSSSSIYHTGVITHISLNFQAQDTADCFRQDGFRVYDVYVRQGESILLIMY